MPKVSNRRSRSSDSGVNAVKPYTPHSNDTSKGQRKAQTGNLIAPNTTIGQHFLKNPAVVNSIIQKSGIKVCLHGPVYAYHTVIR